MIGRVIFLNHVQQPLQVCAAQTLDFSTSSKKRIAHYLSQHESNMKNKFGIFIVSILFSVNAYSFTTSDIVSIACSDSSRAFGVLGVNIRDELVKIQKDSNLNSTQLELKIRSLEAEMRRMEGDIYQIISKERSELFKRFGSMIYVDMYILINSGTPTRSFIIAHNNPSINASQLLPKLNSDCISEQLAGIEKARNNQR